MRKTPAAFLAACSLGLGLWACGGSGGSASNGQPGMHARGRHAFARGAARPIRSAPSPRPSPWPDPGAQFKANGQAVDLVGFQQAAGDSTFTTGDAGAAPPAFGPDSVAVDRGADVGLPFCGGAPDIGAVETGC